MTKQDLIAKLAEATGSKKTAEMRLLLCWIDSKEPEKRRRLYFGRIRQLQGRKEGGPEREKPENGRGHQDQGKQDSKILASEGAQGIAVKK